MPAIRSPCASRTSQAISIVHTPHASAVTASTSGSAPTSVPASTGYPTVVAGQTTDGTTFFTTKTCLSRTRCPPASRNGSE